MAYALDMNATVEDIWPYASALKEIRMRSGNLSVEKAAARIDASRATWNAWESGRQRPSYHYLRAIVEAFGVPPALVGYEPPQGWELVPADWIAAKFDEILLELRNQRPA